MEKYGSEFRCHLSVSFVALQSKFISVNLFSIDYADYILVKIAMEFPRQSPFSSHLLKRFCVTWSTWIIDLDPFSIYMMASINILRNRRKHNVDFVRKKRSVNQGFIRINQKETHQINTRNKKKRKCQYIDTIPEAKRKGNETTTTIQSNFPQWVSFFLIHCHFHSHPLYSVNRCLYLCGVSMFIVHRNDSRSNNKIKQWRIQINGQKQ